MKATRQVILTITYDTEYDEDPLQWNWAKLLDTDRENVSVHEVVEKDDLTVFHLGLIKSMKEVLVDAERTAYFVFGIGKPPEE